MTTFFLFLAQMEESIAEMTTFRQIKAEKAICSDGVSAALQGVPWHGSACTPSAFIFFLLSFGWVGERDFFTFHLFPTCSIQCSHQVLNIFHRFPICSSMVFPITPHFNPICFAQSPPLLTYIPGPKGEALHLSLESPTLGSLHSFNFFLNGPTKLAHCKKRNWTYPAPPTAAE